MGRRAQARRLGRPRHSRQVAAQTDMTIYELQACVTSSANDFSVSAPNRGQYLAFTKAAPTACAT